MKTLLDFSAESFLIICAAGRPLCISSSTLTHRNFCLERGVGLKLHISCGLLADVFLILSQDVVSCQYSWEAREKGKKILSNVQCLERGSRTGIYLSCLLSMFLPGHGSVVNSCYGSVFPPGK